MIKRTYRECLKCSDSYYIKGYYNNGDLTIGGEKIKLGTEIAFVIDNTFYEGLVTGWEKPLYNEPYGDIETIYVDNEEIDLMSIVWLGIN